MTTRYLVNSKAYLRQKDLVTLLGVRFRKKKIPLFPLTINLCINLKNLQIFYPLKRRYLSGVWVGCTYDININTLPTLYIAPELCMKTLPAGKNSLQRLK